MHAMEQARLAKDWLDVLAWPLVGSGVLLLAATVFRQQIQGILNRVIKIRVPGAEVESPQPAIQVLVPPQAVSEETELEVREAEIEREYRDQIESLREQSEQAQREVDWLIAEWARSAAGWHYEYAYRLMYGTQIALVEGVQARQTLELKTTDTELMAYLNRHLALVRPAFPGYEITLAAYVQFLVSSEFLAYDATALTYAVTPYGRGFLDYLTLNAIPRTKPW